MVVASPPLVLPMQLRLSPEQLEQVCQANPAAVLEPSMELYRANGAQLGWLLLPGEQAVEIWTAGGGHPVRIAPAEQLDAGALFPGLQIPLAEIWQA